MPNPVHGILVLIDPPRRGAALDQDAEIPTRNLCSNATPNPHRYLRAGRGIWGRTDALI
ncbi:MAG: hypothetical protein HY785_05060 [Oscillatoriophycideae cyanobacterium NC_groundwater_1537_Pr4_S-0.65um_50_18]|nr:hypothetical protein [Oscillatoriophycideae cyanobacterium NC_groundwater_1537_Pr4_S-0.65um_50_18]